MKQDIKEQRMAKIKGFLESNPEDAFLNYALAIEYVGSNEATLALPILEKLVQNQPNYVASYYHLGKLYQKTDREKEAIATFEKGIEIGKVVKDMHAVKELNDALNEILFDE